MSDYLQHVLAQPRVAHEAQWRDLGEPTPEVYTDTNKTPYLSR